MPQKYLVTVDFSSLAVLGLKRAILLAQGRDIQIDILHVLADFSHTPGLAHPAAADLLHAAIAGERKQVKAELDALMLQIPTEHRGQGLIKEGQPAATICDVAREGYDMLILSTHGRTGLKHMLIGSVAERVVRFATIPVLVVR
jgi:universal stress protein A